MYWLYLFLFMVAVSAPLIIEKEAWYLSEDMQESLVILIAGTLAFLIYAFREKSLLRQVREKLWFQQKTTVISKDLSQSYSYIGEVNRKVDILQGMMRRLVEIQETGQAPERLLWEVLDTLKQMTQSNGVSIRIFTNKVCTHRLEEKKDKKVFAAVSNGELLKNTKSFFTIASVRGVSSQKLRKKTKIFLLFSRAHNDELDEDMLNIILSFIAILDTFVTPENTSS